MRKSAKELIEEYLKDRVLSTRSSGLLQMESGKQYFLKEGAESRSYQCEKNGLLELQKSEAIEIVKPILATKRFILTTYVEQTIPKKGFYRLLGYQLAQMHQYTNSSFGFYEDNFIGSTRQFNKASDSEKQNWIEFYFNKRLLVQYELALQNGAKSSRLKEAFKNLEQHIEQILSSSLEAPSLLHGDLWGGNYLCGMGNVPTLIDPAVYYGHREADLAMTRLFGGFPQEFYTSYQQAYPLKEGWQDRVAIYQLYHVLNHYNMFGGGYLYEAEQLATSYL